ncbi:hypothetical protein DB88DRAFT_188570 [Papiliotrema laurentii]|uniref:Uncharacterized protein n=1 Tax=Papiliotrema laurentii TaxID=5418 RepID=A0AAD9FSA1_PAPLA|nr:hypothetical protein DB88DRAFT_188570 [Papiliotrema laurentii]
MTATTRNAAGAGLPSQLFLHESPSGSSVSLNDDPTLMLPQPAFRRRPGGSNRSSVASSQDLSSLTGEELWSMDQEVVPDMSNPLTRAAERPLDTVRRMSSRVEHSPYRNGLPQDVIWPAAPPPADLYTPPVKSRSVTSMGSLRSVNKSKRLSRRSSRQISVDMHPIAPGKLTDGSLAGSTPASPKDGIMISSNNSSSTSLASHVIAPNKSSVTLASRPPSVYYSRDFLSSLAPREGGYAIAAQMGNGLGAVGTMSVEERRRSSVMSEDRPRSLARAPVSRSAGMGRWSLDGGEHYGRPYGTPSNATTSTSFGRATSQSDPSPPADDESARGSYLPEGAASPVGVGSAPASIDSVSPPPPIPSSVPVNPSPLSREATAHPSPVIEPPAALPPLASDAPTPVPTSTHLPPAAPAVPPVPVTQPPLNTKKSKKELKAAAKEAKAAEKAAALKISVQRAEQARQATLKREAEKAAAKKKKEDDKRREKEEKERRKAEKKASKQKPTPAPATQPAPAPAPAPIVTSALPPRNTSSSVQSNQLAQAPPPPRPQPVSSGPMARPPPVQTASSASVGKANGKARLGMFGTIKKRLASFGEPRPSSGPNGKTASTRGEQSFKAQNTVVKSEPPPMPTTPTKAAGPQTPAPSTPSGHVDAAEISTPQPLSELPPRTSSHTTPVAQAGSPLAQSHRTTSSNATPVLIRANSEQSPRPVESSPLYKTLSHEGRTGGSPTSSRRGGSIRGPRPMPRAAHSPERHRSASISNSIAEQQRALTSYPDHHNGEMTGAPGAVTPSASSESADERESSMFSHSVSKGSQHTDLASPFTSDGSEMDTKRSELGDLGDFEPEREGSNETIHPKAPPTLPAVSAH